MRKIFCDHCNKDITNDAINTLTSNNGECHFDYAEHHYVGNGYHLCDDCYCLRERDLAEFDRAFLKLEND